ncbi:MAG: glycosyltransferase family A protein [Lyngbya sp.]|nr:glycosyltransferase family A protein [Lyngbya sp.]
MSNSSDLPLLSAVIPTYNRARLICTSLTSVINQSYKNLEIIVVDDGSTDNTKEVVESINDPRINYIHCSSNQGGATARNIGIDAAKGEYIAFLDSDDAWVPKKLEIQLNEILKHPHPEVIVSYTQVFHSLSGISEKTYNNFDEKFIIPKQGKSDTETVSDYLFCKKGKTLTSTLMLKRSLASTTRFRDGLRKHQDWDFCIRLEAKGALFSFIQQPLTIWNGDPSYDHVGRISNYHLSESWFRECRSHISSKAATAFLFNKILPPLMKSQQRKPYAQKILINAHLQKFISFQDFVRLSRKIWKI